MQSLVQTAFSLCPTLTLAFTCSVRTSTFIELMDEVIPAKFHRNSLKNDKESSVQMLFHRERDL